MHRFIVKVAAQDSDARHIRRIRNDGQAVSIYEALSEPLSNGHQPRLDDLLKRRDNGKTT